MAKRSGIERALEKYDNSPTTMARAVGYGVVRQHIEHWKKVGRVAAERCPEVSAATGIPCSVLNDSVKWAMVGKEAKA